MLRGVASSAESDRQAVEHVVVIGASAGGLAAASRVLSSLPDELPAALVVVFHLMQRHQSNLPAILGLRTSLPVTQAVDGGRLRAGRVYVAPPGAHTLVDAHGRFALDAGPPVRHVRPSIDRCLASFADAYGERVVAVVLSGAGRDGAEGVRLVKDAGGTVLAQSAETSQHKGMPEAAAATGAADRVLPLDEIAEAIVEAVTVTQRA